MKVWYAKIVDDSIDLPDMVGVNTPDGVKMIYCEEIEDSDYHVARYQSMVTDRCQLTVDVYKDVDGDWTSFEVCAKLKYGEAAGEIIYHNSDDPDEVLDILGKAFAEAEKKIPEYKGSDVKIPVKLTNLDEVKKKIIEVLDLI